MFQLPSPVQELDDEDFAKAGVRFLMKRDDLIHPQISGNKWRKLKYNLLQARHENKNVLLTFGGAFSNHIHATAAAGKLLGFQTIGIIRGEKILPLNQTLAFAENLGMKLYFLNRTNYRNKNSEEILVKIKEFVSEDFFLIPEGGANEWGVKGCMEIVPEITEDFDYLCCPCGTATTFRGLANSVSGKQKAFGFSVLKENFEEKDINMDYHFGGYAKTTPELLHFIRNFEARHGILLEQVYTGKMLFGIYELLKKGFFKRGETVIALHTGGLQGRNF